MKLTNEQLTEIVTKQNLLNHALYNWIVNENIHGNLPGFYEEIGRNLEEIDKYFKETGFLFISKK